MGTRGGYGPQKRGNRPDKTGNSYTKGVSKVEQSVGQAAKKQANRTWRAYNSRSTTY